jgi:hypothetical protein
MAEILIDEQGTPSTPTSGKTTLFVDSVDSHLKQLDSTGTVIDLTEAGTAPTNRVLVTTASDLAGTLDSTIEYFIDGIIDMGTTQIEVPAGGLNLTGYNFDVSKLISSANSYTMFVSPVGGSGNVLGKDYAIEVTGTGSQVYDLVSQSGFDAFEFQRVNYNNCTSLGSIDNYRQGLESGTGRFGGTPELTLVGTWVGGYFIETSIVRSLTDGAYSLFKAGAGFSMNSRFRTNQNIDLPASASFFDFAASNFPNPSTLQVTGAIVSRSGAFDTTDSNITPNITEGELACAWHGNVGIPNTFEGGKALITVETATIVSATSTYYDLAGTWTASDLQHYDSPANGQLRHLGNTPREYKAIINVTIDGPANDEVSLRVVKWDDSASTDVVVINQNRQINNLVGGRDIAIFNVATNVALDANDYIRLQVSNETTTGNLTAELDSFFIVEER